MLTLLTSEAYKGFSAGGIFYRGKMEMAKFFCRNILAKFFAQHTVLQQEYPSALDIPEEVF